MSTSSSWRGCRRLWGPVILPSSGGILKPQTLMFLSGSQTYLFFWAFLCHPPPILGSHFSSCPPSLPLSLLSPPLFVHCFLFLGLKADLSFPTWKITYYNLYQPQIPSSSICLLFFNKMSFTCIIFLPSFLTYQSVAICPLLPSPHTKCCYKCHQRLLCP